MKLFFLDSENSIRTFIPKLFESLLNFNIHQLFLIAFVYNNKKGYCFILQMKVFLLLRLL